MVLWHLLVLFIFLVCPVLSALWNYGVGNGHVTTPSADTGSSGALILDPPFKFYGRSYSTLYVNNDGSVSLGATANYQDTTRTTGSTPAVCGFCSDIDVTKAGTVWYKLSQSLLDRHAVADDVTHYTEFPQDFLPSWVLVATWEGVSSFLLNDGNVNTFQVLAATDGSRSLVQLLYEDITWVHDTVDLSEFYEDIDPPDIRAQCGFLAGDGATAYLLPGSSSEELLNITRTSNTGVSGKFVFRVDKDVVGLSEHTSSELSRLVFNSESSSSISPTQSTNYISPSPINSMASEASGSSSSILPTPTTNYILQTEAKTMPPITPFTTSIAETSLQPSEASSDLYASVQLISESKYHSLITSSGSIPHYGQDTGSQSIIHSSKDLVSESSYGEISSDIHDDSSYYTIQLLSNSFVTKSMTELIYSEFASDVYVDSSHYTTVLIPTVLSSTMQSIPLSMKQTTKEPLVSVKTTLSGSDPEDASFRIENLDSSIRITSTNLPFVVSSIESFIYSSTSTIPTSSLSDYEHSTITQYSTHDNSESTIATPIVSPSSTELTEEPFSEVSSVDIFPSVISYASTWSANSDFTPLLELQPESTTSLYTTHIRLYTNVLTSSYEKYETALTSQMAIFSDITQSGLYSATNEQNTFLYVSQTNIISFSYSEGVATSLDSNVNIERTSVDDQIATDITSTKVMITLESSMCIDTLKSKSVNELDSRNSYTITNSEISQGVTNHNSYVQQSHVTHQTEPPSRKGDTDSILLLVMSSDKTVSPYILAMLLSGMVLGVIAIVQSVLWRRHIRNLKVAEQIKENKTSSRLHSLRFRLRINTKQTWPPSSSHTSPV